MADKKDLPCLRQGLAYLAEGFRVMDGVDNHISRQMAEIMGTTVEQLEQVGAFLQTPSQLLQQRNHIRSIAQLPDGAAVACQGVAGAYQHMALNCVFDNPAISFYRSFDDVTKAVANNITTFGVLPLENSSAGTVEDVMESICANHCYIHTVAQMRIEHCLAARPGSRIEMIETVYSHPQALRQCRQFIAEHGWQPEQAANTAIAAEYIAVHGNAASACICSVLSAKLYGLEILQQSIQDNADNYTRFACIARDCYILPEANTVALALGFPNKPGALNHFLTMFSALDLDLVKIQSMPIGGADFLVRFHLEFRGNIFDSHVANLLSHMYHIYEDFQFLGNFRMLFF